MISVLILLNAVIQLNIAKAIWQDGANAPLSPSENFSHLDAPNRDPQNLQHILQMLSSYGTFMKHIHAIKGCFQF